MATVNFTNAPAIPHCEIAIAQHLENAISTAQWHLRHGRINEATGRILSAARHLKQAPTTATTSGRA